MRFKIGDIIGFKNDRSKGFRDKYKILDEDDIFFHIKHMVYGEQHAIEKKKFGRYFTKVKDKNNPPSTRGAIKIYDEIEEIKAIKGKNSLWPKERFKHSFKSSSKGAIYGLPDGSILIKSATGKKLWKMFEYSDRTGKRR